VVLGKSFLVGFIHVFQGSFCEGKSKLGVFLISFFWFLKGFFVGWKLKHVLFGGGGFI
jgi:hypothetical protein